MIPDPIDTSHTVMTPKPSIKIAVIGDVHDQWEQDDADALKALEIDLALFVGDFGNESVEVVEAIAELDLPKAVVFGNHDAWYNATAWGRAKCPYNLKTDNRVRKQLDLLGNTHVGYGKLDFPQFGITVVGGRPFSWGGPEWRNKTFFKEWYGIESFAQSAEKIKTAVQTAAFNTLIFIGHCGPTGLGDAPEAICGRDWNPIGGDFGDPDLTEAIAYAKAMDKSIPLVTFGHMHHRLRHRKDRLREQIVVDPENTVNLNAASVPRIVDQGSKKLRNFSLVSMEQGTVSRVALIWVDDSDTIQTEDVLFNAEPSFARTAHTGTAIASIG